MRRSADNTPLFNTPGTRHWLHQGQRLTPTAYKTAMCLADLNSHSVKVTVILLLASTTTKRKLPYVHATFLSLKAILVRLT